ncbi:MAG: methionine adenosyltransferase, partial [Bacteroidales bacterium]|nr:methionine adenosyltransferase [Bacteroidales bacterium]
MAYYFTSESVSEGHPDKVADQISDALLDEFLRQDPHSRVACETLVTTGLCVVAGEVKTSGYVDIQDTVRDVIRNIGYTKGEYMFEANSCGIMSAIHGQSPDINQGVDRKELENQGAGDQGMMFGYACKETQEYMPLPITLAHNFMLELANIRKEGKEMTYLRPDSKSQITVEYSDDNKPMRIDTIVISTQHDDFGTEKKMLATIRKDVENILIPRVLKR